MRLGSRTLWAMLLRRLRWLLGLRFGKLVLKLFYALFEALGVGESRVSTLVS